MAPNQNNQNSDYQPSTDQQTSLSSQKIKNSVKMDYLQFYDFKMRPNSQGSNQNISNSHRGLILISMILISLMIIYSLVVYSEGWNGKIKPISEGSNMNARLPRKGQPLEAQQSLAQTSKIGVTNQQRRNPKVQELGNNAGALLLTFKQSDHHLEENQIQMSETSIYQRRKNLQKVQLLSKSYLPQNNQILTNNIQHIQQQKQSLPIYQVVDTAESLLQEHEKPKLAITADEYTPIKVEPMIHPFNSRAKSSSNGIRFIGNEAGITTQMLFLARQRRKIANHELNHQDNLTKQQIEYYQDRYNVGKYEELPFCIVVPTFNNAVGERYKKNIHSIIMQNYTNYHIVIIDDASSDSTGILIKNYLLQSNFDSKRYLIKTNQIQQNAMPNLRSAALQHCKDEQIFLVVDGDDELIGRQVLKVFNAVFQEKGLWFVYSNFLLGFGQLGYSRPFPKEVIRQNLYRSSAFVSSHLRAFYTKLFKNIQEKDLKTQYGNYFRAANDVAICFPVLEQAHLKVGYLPQMTYFYNADTGINNHYIRLDEQKANEMSVRNRKHYEPLEKLF